MKYCPYCGCQLNDDVKFCTNCGASMADVQPTQPAPEPQAQAYNIPGYDPNYQPYQQAQQPSPYQGNPYQQPVNPTPAVYDSGSIGWIIPGFIIPIAGFILWLIWKDKRPKNAQKALIGAGIGFAINLIYTLLTF